MKLVFKEIPKFARYCYLSGFIIILVAMVNYVMEPPFMGTLLMQQSFIAGAIIVALGSVINTLHQFNSKK